MTPKLSVIIPVRDGLGFVRHAIASAQAIPVAPLEIVVVDDGSTDGTLELLQRLAEDDPRLLVIRRDRDHGAAAARNAGIAAARADIVCFVDADDTVYAGPIARRLEWHEAHPEAVLSFADHHSVLPGGAIERRFADYYPRFEKFVNGRKGIVELGDQAFDLLFGENPVCTTGSMARRDALIAVGGFAPELRRAQDWDMWIRLARCGGVAYSNGIETRYTVRPDSLSHNIEDRNRNIAKVVRRHLGFALRRHPLAALAALSRVEDGRAEQRRIENRNVAAWAHYLNAFVLSPNRRQARDFARATAVLMGLREGRVESLEQRARLAAGHVRSAADVRARRPLAEAASLNIGPTPGQLARPT